MKVCDVVLNSVWWDPRVIKQVKEYHNQGLEIVSVGIKDKRYNSDEIAKLPGSFHLVERSFDVTHKWYSNKALSFFSMLIDLVKVSRAIRQEKPDIIHANDLNALVPAYYASKGRKTVIIYDTHEIFLENYDIFSSRIKRIFWSYLENKIIRRIDKVVCVSNAAADYLAQKYNIKRPIVITHGMSKADIHQPHKRTSSKFEVLIHGKFYQGRGYDLMIEGAKINTNANIKYVLRGFGEMKEQLENEKREYKLDNVEFASPVKTDELVSAATTSDVGVAITIPHCLNFKLSVSNKLFEYAAAGLPLIMSDIPEHRYLNDKYNFGIILEDNTPQALNAAIEILYSNIDLYNEYAENAYKMSQIMNWEEDFSKLIGFERTQYCNKR